MLRRGGSRLGALLLASLWAGLSWIFPTSPTLCWSPPRGKKRAAWQGSERLAYTSGKLKITARCFRPRIRNAAATAHPAIIYCHDGVSGISRETLLFCREMADWGYVVFAPAFRGEDGSDGEVEVAKGEVQDVLSAISFVKKLPGVDPRRIALLGTSHGALIAILAASRTSEIVALIECYGVTNVYAWWDYLKTHGFDTDDPLSRKTYGKGPKDRPQAFEIRDARAVAHRISCPVLILHGEKDRIVPADQAIEFHSVLVRLGKNATFKQYKDAGHGFLVYAPPFRSRDSDSVARKQALDDVRDFLVQTMR
ncbi:MAG: alpha/beta fold hydrolase [Armatimonadetes bacterium]|nr:alpha/beta fold hydrolase [Armatimonadota bacterium]